MRTVEITGFGGPEVLRIGEASRPKAAPGQIVVKVAAAGVNPVDWKVREGYLKDVMPFTFPTILGNELAGTIEEIGEGVTTLAVGDEVHGAVGMIGGYADYVASDAGNFTRKPSNISMVEAAALPVAVVTARAALDAGAVGPGSRILIHAAAGGVGSIAVQMAKLRGAEVTALASGGHIAFVKDLGADHVVDRTTPYEETLEGFDMVLDAYGPEAQARSWGLLKKGGILVTLVVPPSEETAAQHGVRATMVFGAPNAAILAEADRDVEAGKLKVEVARTYPVEKVADAFAESQAGKVRGKLVLTFD